MASKILSAMLMAALTLRAMADGPSQQCDGESSQCRPYNGVLTSNDREPAHIHLHSQGDTCASIGSWSGLTLSQIEGWNPGVNCSSLASLVGHYYLCLSVYTPSCTKDVTIQAGDTCTSLEAAWGLSQSDPIALNDNLDSACDNLVVGQQYCISDQECFPGNTDPCCTPSQAGCSFRKA